MVHISSVSGFNLSDLGQTIKNGVNRVMDGILEATRLEGRYYDGEFDGYDEDYKDDYSEEIIDEKLVEVLLYDPPKKAYIAYKDATDETIIKLYDDSGECYYKDKIEGNLQDEYNKLVFEYTTSKDLGKKDIINISVIDGGGKPGRNIRKSFKTLSPDTREQVARALINMQNDNNKERIYIQPIFPDYKDKGANCGSFKIDYYLFELKLAELGSSFDIEPVLEDLNSSLDENIFNDSTIEEVLVGNRGYSMALKTKDGYRAVLNFSNGRREITSLNPQEDGLSIVMLDNNGPMLRCGKKGR